MNANETRPPKLSLEALHEFCKRKAPSRRYPAQSPTQCAICEFLHANGYPNADVLLRHWYPEGASGSARRLPTKMNALVQAHPWTFGALTQRLADALR